MSRIIAIASGKGGVGKTWLSVTLAQALARLGRRILMFDADLGLANVDVQLALEPGDDLGTALAGRRLTDVIRHYEAGGFDVIAGRSGSGQLALLPTEILGRLTIELRQIAASYDDVLLDLPAGIDMTVRQMLSTAHQALIVTTDEPPAMTDAYALIKVGRRHVPTMLPELVINLAPGEATGRQTYESLRRVCERFLDLRPPLAGVIRRDPRVADAIRHQAPFLIRHPLAPAARDVQALARHLAGDA